MEGEDKTKRTRRHKVNKNVETSANEVRRMRVERRSEVMKMEEELRRKRANRNGANR